MLTPIENTSKLEQLIRTLICIEGLYYSYDNEDNPILNKIYEIVHGVLGCGTGSKNCPMTRDLLKNLDKIETSLDEVNVIKFDHIQKIVDKIIADINYKG